MGTVGVVLDTNVLISALGWGGKPDECVRLGLRGEVDLLGSPATLMEFARVLDYPRFGFTEAEKTGFYVAILSRTTVLQPDETVGAIESDPDDNVFLSCAVAGDAAFVVSGDKHLLDLGSFQGIRIVTPAQFLQEWER